MTSSGRRKGKALGAKLLLVGNQDGSWKQNLSGETQLMTGNKNTSSSLEVALAQCRNLQTTGMHP